MPKNLRIALRIVLLLSGALVMQAEEPTSNPAEAQAETAVRALGISITRDESLPGRPVIAASLDSHVRHFEDADVASLKAFKSLRKLSLPFANITDAGLKELADLKDLQELDLSSTQRISSKGLESIRGLRHLRSLNLSNSFANVSPGLRDLAALQELEVLELAMNGTGGPTDEVLKELATIKTLRKLNANCTVLTDTGLQALAALTNLESLDLNSMPRITDEGLKSLRGLRNLQHLSLNYTSITDAGMRELRELKKLRSLSLAGTKVTEEGLKDLADIEGLRGSDLGVVIDPGQKPAVLAAAQKYVAENKINVWPKSLPLIKPFGGKWYRVHLGLVGPPSGITYHPLLVSTDGRVVDAQKWGQGRVTDVIREILPPAHSDAGRFLHLKYYILATRPHGTVMISSLDEIPGHEKHP